MTILEVSAKVTLPTAPFANVLPELRITAFLEPTDDREACMRNLQSWINLELKAYAQQLVATFKELKSTT